MREIIGRYIAASRMAVLSCAPGKGEIGRKRTKGNITCLHRSKSFISHIMYWHLRALFYVEGYRLIFVILFQQLGTAALSLAAKRVAANVRHVACRHSLHITICIYRYLAAGIYYWLRLGRGARGAGCHVRWRAARAHDARSKRCYGALNGASCRP